MAVPLLDLKAQYATIRSEIESVVRRIFEDQEFILGPAVERFEQNVRRLCGVEHAVGVSSGSDALMVSLMAAGIGPGDEVITTPFSFFATAGAIERVGATIVLADIEADTFNLDPEAVEAEITSKTKAIVPVHLFGQMARMEHISEIANRYDLLVIEDAAQAIGAKRGDRPAGSMGTYGCFSFFPSKNLGGAGDGGMVVCRDAERAEFVRALRNHGASAKGEHPWVGGNFRLDALQAAVLDVKLPHLASWSRARRDNANVYRSLLSDVVNVGRRLEDADLVLPVEENVGTHTYNQFTLRARKRDGLCRHLADRRIGHSVYYPIPFHLQPCFEHLGYGQGRFPESERAAKEVISLPIYPELERNQLEEVVEAIEAFYR